MAGAPDRLGRVRAIFDETARLHAALDDTVLQGVIAAADAIERTLRDGGKVLVCGNGGSAAEAQHLAAELMGRFMRDRDSWPAVALTTDTSALTAIANDYGFERVFARQVEGLGRTGDVLVAISTSGESPNVVAALETAAARGLVTVAFTGRDGGTIGRRADVHVNVPHHVTARAQEVQLTQLHAVCALVETAMTEGEAAPRPRERRAGP